ncbi:MAG: hypothetical protein N3G20_09445 [Verrucomicrobiae bacterium]|nr:hypothetical protein [Verrucomicrobiae bacterium]
MPKQLPRRRFLGTATIAASGFGLLRCSQSAGDGTEEHWEDPGFPVVDLHVHLDNSTIDKVLALPQARRVRFGIVEHAGNKENKYPVVLSNDTELDQYLLMLHKKPVYRGVQAEWIDWMTCFSRDSVSKLDFVLSDAMTFPGKDGQRVKLWEDGALERVGFKDAQEFMDRYVDWHVKVIELEPIDILANTTWLPAQLADDYDRLWTEPRMEKIITAALKHGVALEINATYKLPRLAFLKLAKDAGVKFSFGSNGRYPNMGKLDYCIEVARKLKLGRKDIFTPAPDGQKAVQRRWPSVQGRAKQTEFKGERWPSVEPELRSPALDQTHQG